MQLYPRRLQEASRNPHPRFIDSAYGIFAQENEKSKKFLVFPASANRALVSTSNTVGRGYSVDIETRACSCSVWQDRRLPCRHGLAFLNHLRLDAEQCIDGCYRIESYTEAFRGELSVVANNHLLADDTLLPGGTQEIQPRGRGRPSTRKRGYQRTRDQRERQQQRMALHRSIQEEEQAAEGVVTQGEA